jgi:geranylgeranylglycerol-phosphate geranylgeranyltransferase
MNSQAYIRIIRPFVCIQLGTLSILGMILTGKDLPELTFALGPFLSAFLIAASIHTLNDYVDYEVDLVNTPWRPIPSGKISRPQALGFGIALGIGGVAITLFYNPVAATLLFLIFILTNYYSIKAKIYGFIGHVIVAFCFASYFLYGVLILTNQIEPYLLNIYGLCFLYILGGEVVQSIADAEGDKIRGVRSVALVNSPRTAAIVATACYALMALLGAYTITKFAPSLDTYFSGIILTFTLLYIGIITVPLLRKPENETAIKTRTRINTMGLLMILIFLLYLVI